MFIYDYYFLCKHYLWLLFIVIGNYLLLSIIIDNCCWLLIIIDYYWWLLMIFIDNYFLNVCNYSCLFMIIMFYVNTIYDYIIMIIIDYYF